MQNSQATQRPIYRGVLLCLMFVLLTGIFAYSQQSLQGLGVTGLSRAVPWGLYISQFTFLVGIAASSVLVVLPYHVHDKADFAPLVIIGEALSVSALISAFSFILVDLGRPARVLGVLLHPSPTSLMFWDILTLTGYLLLCVTILMTSLLAPDGARLSWLRPFILLSIPFAFGIHIVTALLYCGLASRPGWMTAILAPKFLSTAFASGSALLILVGSSLNAAGLIRVERTAFARLTNITTYALGACLLFSGLELFTGLYSGLPSAEQHFDHLFPGYAHAGLETGEATSGGVGSSTWMQSCMLLAAVSSLCAFVMLLLPGLRKRSHALHVACAFVVFGTLLEKGLVFIPSGFFPSTFGDAIAYRPTLIEVCIAGGIYSGGAIVFLLLLGPVCAHARHLKDHPQVHSAIARPSANT